MATFDPQYNQVQDQSFLGYAKEITQPQGATVADKSAGIALSGAGNLLEEGVTAADKLEKKSIENEVYEQVDPVRNKYIASLTNVDEAINPNGGGNLLNTDTAEVPAQIKQGIATLQKNQQSMEQGKINNLDYLRTLNGVATRIRADHPVGYRPYIDQEISKITGGIPANELVQGLVADINKTVGRATSEKDKMEAFIKTNSDLPYAPEMFDAFHRGEIGGNEIMQWANFNQGIERKLKLQQLRMSVDTGNRTQNINNATDYIQELTNQRINQALSNPKFAMNKNTITAIEDRLTDAAANPGKYKDTEVQILGEQYKQMQGILTQQVMRELNVRPVQQTEGPPTADGKGPAPIVGKSALDIAGHQGQQVVQNTIGAFFHDTTQRIFDKDFGGAHSNQNRVTGIVNGDAPMSVLQSDIGTEMAVSGAVNRIGGPALGPFVQEKIIPRVDKKVGPVIDSMTKRAITQFDYGKTGIPNTFSGDVAKLNSVKGGVGPDAYRGLSNIVDVITSSDPRVPDEAKVNAVKYFYDPSNAGVLKKFATSDGKVPSKYSVFLRLTSDDATRSIKELSDRTGDPSIWHNYSEWAKGEFGKQLFGNDIMQLNSLYELNGMESLHNKINPRSVITGSADNNITLPDYHIKYTSDKASNTYKFELINSKGENVYDVNPRSQSAQAINNINFGLSSMANIAKAEGTNVDAYLIRSMLQAGWNPNKDKDQIPAKIMQAILSSYGPNKPEKKAE